jgi:rhodanese-related sulfurtransferase
MNKTGADLIADAKTRIVEIAPDQATKLLAAGDATFLDVREPQEYNLGRLPGAVHVPRGMLEVKVESMISRDANIIVYCAAGARSALAADTLYKMGYTNVSSLRGGFRDWAMGGGAVEE